MPTLNPPKPTHLTPLILTPCLNLTLCMSGPTYKEDKQKKIP